MMLPILISVSVAPTSYYFCARAAELVSASTTRAAERAPNRNWIAGILISLIWSNVSIFLMPEHFAAPRGIQYLIGIPGKKNASCDGLAGGVI